MSKEFAWYEKDESVRKILESVSSSPWDEYRNHPGQFALEKWSDIGDFYSGIVVANEMALIGYLTIPSKSKRIRKKMLKLGDSAYGIEATRRLYNYISSISSLADHTMNFMKDYKDTKFHKEYNRRLRKVTSLGEFAFLKDLRNYAVHYKIPPVGYIVGSANVMDKNVAFLPVIYTGDLFDYKNWSKESKKYINDNFPQIELIKLVKTYAKAINDLYSWLFSQFNTIHGDEFRESEKIKQKIVDT